MSDDTVYFVSSFKYVRAILTFKLSEYRELDSSVYIRLCFSDNFPVKFSLVDYREEIIKLRDEK